MDEYNLYTYPSCDKCAEVKEFLKSKGVNYNEIDMKSNAGFQKFREIYSKKKDEIKRDAEHGNMIIMPVLVKLKDSGIEAILQNIQDIKALFP